MAGWAAETFGSQLLVKGADGVPHKVDTTAHLAAKKLVALYFSAHVRAGAVCGALPLAHEPWLVPRESQRASSAPNCDATVPVT